MMVWGWLVLLGGIVGAFLSQSMQVTANYSETLNIGRLQDQMMAFQASLAAILAGVLILVGDMICKAITGKK